MDAPGGRSVSGGIVLLKSGIQCVLRTRYGAERVGVCICTRARRIPYAYAYAYAFDPEDVQMSGCLDV